MSTREFLTYATRRSPLALAQCRAFVARFQAFHTSRGAPIEARELQVVTSGDRIQDRPLSEAGGKGLFVKEIEEVLLEGRADFAVHSMKDLPATLPPLLAVACIPAREDPRDVLVAPRHGALSALPIGARVGTSSLRRLVALRRHRPDLRIVPVRGNVDTRLRKVDAGEYDALVLARAGLLRLGMEHRATEVLSADIVLPAPAQGALAIECRTADAPGPDAFRLARSARPSGTIPRSPEEPPPSGASALAIGLAALHDSPTALCVAAERSVLEAVGGDCKMPLAAYAERIGDILRLRAFMARPDGTEWRSVDRSVHWTASEDEARALGRAAGERIIG